MDRHFEKKYSVEVPKLILGKNVTEFDIDRSFFDEIRDSLVNDGQIHVDAVFTKNETHIDAHFSFKGYIYLECDRCMEPYKYQLAFDMQMVFSYDPDLEFDSDEVILIEKDTPRIVLWNEFYEFICLQIPLRKVPEPDVHLCPPNVLAMLGLNPDGSEMEFEDEETEEEDDPRWNELKKLKNKNK